MSEETDRELEACMAVSVPSRRQWPVKCVICCWWWTIQIVLFAGKQGKDKQDIWQQCETLGTLNLLLNGISLRLKNQSPQIYPCIDSEFGRHKQAQGHSITTRKRCFSLFLSHGELTTENWKCHMSLAELHSNCLILDKTTSWRQNRKRKEKQWNSRWTSNSPNGPFVLFCLCDQNITSLHLHNKY